MTTCSSRCCTRSPLRPLAPADIAQPIRTILSYQANASVMLGEVDRADLSGQFLHAGDSRVPYDLILAPGAVDNYFGHAAWHEQPPPYP
ncbi:MAG: hypothetical protein ACREU6_06260 [Steroidobacteraceae bacterium]